MMGLSTCGEMLRGHTVISMDSTDEEVTLQLELCFGPSL